MARFYGKVGYGESREVPEDSGVWKDVITEYPYFGDVIRNTRDLDDAEKVNFDISVGNSISVVADDQAMKHFFKIRYVEWQGVKWTVKNVEVKAPRLIFSLDKVYNGPVPVV